MSIYDVYQDYSDDQTRWHGGIITPNRRQDGGYPANVGRLKALYEGTDNQTNLASPQAFYPVSAIMALVGAPILISKDDRTQEKLNEIRRQYINDEASMLTQTMLVTGTGWRWPQWDGIENRWYVETIGDDEVTGYTQAENGSITEMWLDKYVQTNGGSYLEPMAAGYRLRRHITKDIIEVEYTGAINKHYTRLNYFSTFPIPFGYKCWEGSWRGNSAYGRTFRTLKFYHDVQYKEGQVLSKFNPKQVQTGFDNGPDSFDKWLNSRHGGGMVDVLDDELIYNLTDSSRGTETTDFKFLPSDSINGYETALKRLERMNIIGSSIPEIFWPFALTGNMASAAYQTQQGINYIKDVQRQETTPYQKEMRQLLNLIGYIDGYQYGDVEVSWDDFDMLTPSERIEKFDGFATGLTTLINANCMTKEMAIFFARKFYKDFPHKTAQKMQDAMTAWFRDFKQPQTEAASNQVTPDDLAGLMGGDFGGSAE